MLSQITFSQNVSLKAEPEPRIFHFIIKLIFAEKNRLKE